LAGYGLSANDPKRTSTARHSFRSASLSRYYDDFRLGDLVMRQREFVTLVGATAVGWPFAARARQLAKLPAIGFLGPNSATFDKAH